MSLKVGGGYRPLSGTSMATPMVTGAVAQMLQKWPTLKPDQLKSTLKTNARDLGLQSNFEGSGVINMESVFNETQKSSTSSLSSILNNLFGNLFGKKNVSGASNSDNSDLKSAEAKPAANNPANRFNPLNVAMLALIPLLFI
jgi:serine protease AprX